MLRDVDLLQAHDTRKEAEKTAKEARKEAEDAAKNNMAKNTPTVMVPKPKAADFNEGTDRLRKVMGLMDDKAEYLAIQVSHHLLMITYQCTD